MGFNLGTSSNTGKLHMTDFLKTDNAVQNTEKEIPMATPHKVHKLEIKHD